MFVLCVVVVVVVVFGGTTVLYSFALFPPPPLFLSATEKPPKFFKNLVFHYLGVLFFPSSFFKKFRNNAFHFHRVEQHYLVMHLPTQIHARTKEP